MCITTKNRAIPFWFYRHWDHHWLSVRRLSGKFLFLKFNFKMCCLKLLSSNECVIHIRLLSIHSFVSSSVVQCKCLSIAFRKSPAKCLNCRRWWLCVSKTDRQLGMRARKHTRRDNFWHNPNGICLSSHFGGNKISKLFSCLECNENTEGEEQRWCIFKANTWKVFWGRKM